MPKGRSRHVEMAKTGSRQIQNKIRPNVANTAIQNLKIAIPMMLRKRKRRFMRMIRRMKMRVIMMWRFRHIPEKIMILIRPIKKFKLYKCKMYKKNPKFPKLKSATQRERRSFSLGRVRDRSPRQGRHLCSHQWVPMAGFIPINARWRVLKALLKSLQSRQQGQ